MGVIAWRLRVHFQWVRACLAANGWHATASLAFHSVGEVRRACHGALIVPAPALRACMLPCGRWCSRLRRRLHTDRRRNTTEREGGTQQRPGGSSIFGTVLHARQACLCLSVGARQGPRLGLMERTPVLLHAECLGCHQQDQLEPSAGTVWWTGCAHDCYLTVPSWQALRGRGKGSLLLPLTSLTSHLPGVAQ